MLLVTASLVWTCGGGQRTTLGDEPTYRAGLLAANEAQATRNARLTRGTVSVADSASLARLAAQQVTDLGAYRQSLDSLEPPSRLRDAHEKMVDATNNLIDNYREIADDLSGPSMNETSMLTSIPILRENSEALSAFKRACRSLNGPEFVCGALLEAGVTLTPTTP